MKRLGLVVVWFLLPGLFMAVVSPFLSGSPNPPMKPFDGVEGKWAKTTLDQMKLTEKIGQLFMVAAYSNKDETHIREIEKLITEQNIGGLIFMQGGPARQADLVNRLQGKPRIPLLMAQDSEWGLNMRLDSVKGFPKNMTLGAILDDSLLFVTGAEMARQCKRVGVQMNFSPVVDVNNNARNPVINDRSFGEQPELVAKKGIAMSNGMKSNGVIACAKHFPGHGDTDTDSHLDLPVIPYLRSRLDSIELLPFRAMISNGVPSIMIAHLYIPNLDSTKNRASTLSYPIVTGLLKEEMGFEGLIVTDALNMQGVAKFYQPGEVDLQAFLAGNDILLFSGNVPRAIELIAEAVQKGVISEAEVDKRVMKILIAKEWAGLHKTRGLVNPIRDLSELNTDHAEILRKKLFESALTVALNKNHILPLGDLSKKSIVNVQIGGNPENAFFQTLKKYTGIQQAWLPQNPDAQTRAVAISKIGKSNTVVIDVHGINKYASKEFGIGKGLRDLITELKKTDKDIILVLFGSPYAAKFFGSEDALLVAYEDDPWAHQAAAEAIFGGIGWTGQMPVTASLQIKAGMGDRLNSPVRPTFSFPEEAGMDRNTLKKIDGIADEAIRNGATPGCAVLIMRGNKIVFDKAYGRTEYNSNGTEVDPYETIYDLASVTKTSATTLAVMRLVEEGKLKLDESIAVYLPELRETPKAAILVKNLLLHNTGLQAWLPFYTETYDSVNPKVLSPKFYKQEQDERYCVAIMKDLYLCVDYQDSMWVKIQNSDMKNPGKMVYSDLNMIVMARIIEKVSGARLDKYVDSVFYKPMGMDHTFFNPALCGKGNACAPSEIDNSWRKGKVQGFVHDQASAMLGGVSGHAGLFSNVYDLAKLYYMVMSGGTFGGKRFLDKATIEQFTAAQESGNRRGLGWDKPEPTNPAGSHASKYASTATYGHLGFTGICVWVDPSKELIYIFLSNRTFPSMHNGKLISGAYRGRIMDVAYESMNFFDSLSVKK